ncbi:MAG: ATPase, T2SS/T4P/T4SS family, partial [Patescibacteria group bacterium]
LAVQAALTGHLVLSTIHTINAIGIVPRLLDMGVEPYLIPPVLILGIAQRLVRTLCPGGGKRVVIEGSMQVMMKSQFDDLPEEYKKEVPPLDEVYRLEITPECPAGTMGRIACFEVFSMTPELEHGILERKPEDVLFGIVRRQGMFTMKEDAIMKSARGEIPFEEVNTLGGEFELPEADQKPIEAPAPERIEAGDIDEAAAVAEAQKVTGKELSV